MFAIQLRYTVYDWSISYLLYSNCPQTSIFSAKFNYLNLQQPI